MVASAEGLPDIFKSWEVTPSLDDGGLSFGLAGNEGAAISTWIADLPGDPELAARELDRQATYLEQSRRAVDSAPIRAEHLVQSVRSAADAGLSFGTAEGEPLPGPETDALRILSVLENGGGQVAFGIGEATASDVEGTEERFRRALDRALHLLSHQAWVETRTGGNPIGLTIVGWGGDMHNVWSDQADANIYWMHHRSVDQALQARSVQIHAVVVTTTSAAKLGVLLSNPAGAILALPAGWKLVEQILADIDKYKQIKSQEIQDAERI